MKEIEQKLFLDMMIHDRNNGYNFIKLLLFTYTAKQLDINHENYNALVVSKDSLPQLYEEMQKIYEEKIEDIYRLYYSNFSVFEDALKSYSPKLSINCDADKALSIIPTLELKEIEEILKTATFSDEQNLNVVPRSVAKLAIKLLNEKGVNSWFDMLYGDGILYEELVKQNIFFTYQGIDNDFECYLFNKIRICFANKKFNLLHKDVLTTKFGATNNVSFAYVPLINKAINTDDYARYNAYFNVIDDKNDWEWLYLDRLLQVTNHRGIIIMSEHSLTNIYDRDHRIYLFNSNFLEGVIKLPKELFPYKKIDMSMVIINKHKKNYLIKFLDAQKMVINSNYELDVKKIYDEYNKNSIVIDYETAKNYNFSLNASKYYNLQMLKKEEYIKINDALLTRFRGLKLELNKNKDLIINPDYPYNKIKVLSATDLINGIYDVSKLRYIKYLPSYKFAILENDDLFITIKSTTTRVFLITDIPEDEKVVAVGNVIVLRFDKTKINPIYVKAFFESKIGREFYKTIETGTSIKYINVEELELLNIPLIDRAKQDEIAKIYLENHHSIKEMTLLVEKKKNNSKYIFDNYMEQNK